MKRLIYSTVILLFVTSLQYLSAQTAKSYFKSAEAFVKTSNFTDAITSYTKALELDPNFVDAYKARAVAYEKINNFESAIKDYERSMAINPKDFDSYYNAARIDFILNNYEQAISYSVKALEIEKKSLETYDIRINSLIALGKIDEAYEQAEKALDLKKNYQTYFNKAHVLYLQKKYDQSLNFYKEANSDDKAKTGALIGMAESFYMQDLFDKSIENANAALKIDEKCKEAYVIRAKAYKKKIDFANAINDMSKVIVLYPNDPLIKDIYFQRGLYYSEFNQHMMAINDFSEVITRDKNYSEAYFQRAAANEAIRNYDAAIKDYEQLGKLNLKTESSKKLLADANLRLFELKREEDKPVLVFVQPLNRKPGEIEIVKGKEIAVIKGFVKDASLIKSVEVNGNRVALDPNSKKNEFEVNISTAGKTDVAFRISDVYDNVYSESYKIIWTEVDAPVINLVNPVASDDGQIYLQTENTTIFVEGNIMDESLLKSITIDGVNASFIPENINPTFTATVSLVNKKEIKIIAEDIFGNIKEKLFLINRGAAQLATTNPMGTTWVVFIENSSYSSFASLEGPTKDVSMMKSALSQYQIHNIIHKKNMSKAEMEKFFSIDLRDLVKKNQVNSIIVWYAGHGKFINNTGYWIPTDARRDDEFTYFNISSLKSAMQSYSAVVTHTLVITDACESGPTFYQAMRATPVEKDCGDWTATKFKSSQVFSSAGYELASDNSQFTKTFANTLVYNPNTCIPIENVVLKVTSAVGKGKQQKPQFGKIDGLADENGTFFFMKK